MKISTLILLFILVVAPLYGGGKYRVPTDVKPIGLPNTIHPEKQTEGHTCGWHAIRSIYKSYGLIVEDYDLRQRLGVDKKSIPFLRSSQGTIHPDVLRVLDQDGFEYTNVNMKQTSSLRKLHDHFRSGHYALVLINRKQNQALHWVVLSNQKDFKYTVVDSLNAKPYTEDLQFIIDQVQTVLLINPRLSEHETGKMKSHGKGLIQGIKSLF